ncbi:MAG: putative Ig domain-containing protein, partial [Gammaproteobacteria bacterium]|nr:putative Ig domain-containing protein [Gammaproteobacteria bacterium]
MRGQIDLGAVEIGNSLPVFNGLTNVTLDVSDELSVDVDLATDADGDSLTYSVSGLPAGITFDESLNTISGSISKATFNASQTYDITVTANDGYGETEAKFTVTLTDTNGIYSENKSSGSGAFSYLWLSLLGLMFARRRK